MKRATKGILFTIASAVIYGFTPILARFSYEGGANGISLTFLRAALALPFLALALQRMGVSLALTRGQVRDLVLCSGLGGALTTITLYVSYSYIPVGMSTVLHFIYPVLVSLGCVLFYKDRLTPVSVFALIACTLGVFLTAGKIATGSSLFGIVLALLSGVAFAFYVIYLEKSSLRRMHYFKLTFYSCVVVAACAGLFALATGNLQLDLTPRAWFYTSLVSLSVSVGAVTLMQLGVRLTNAVTASILSTFEPITSVILGFLVLHETLTPLQLAGCACIIAGTLAVAVYGSCRE